jgi:hypothetical protein
MLSGIKEEDDDENNTNINKQQNNKGEKPNEGWVLCFLCFYFVMGPFSIFLPSHFFLSPRESSY